MSVLDAAIAATCPGWCTSSHDLFPPEDGGVAGVAHRADLFEMEGRSIDVLRWIEYAVDGSVVTDTTTLFMAGFGDATLFSGDEVAKVATALATAARMLAGVAT